MISVVTFSDRAEVVIPPSRPSDLVRMENRISQIHTGGGTEILKGLETGLAQLSVGKGLRMVRQLFLLTDGHTYGDEQTCFELAKKAAANGITINALGLGHEWNDAFLDRLTSLSGGNTQLITNAKDLYLFLEQKLKSLTTIYARRINFEFQSSPTVELRYAFRINPEVGPVQGTSPIPIGDLLYGKSLVILFEFVLPSLPPDLKKIGLAEGRLVMELPNKEGADVRLPIKINRAVSKDPEPELPPAPIIEAMSHLSLYRLQEKARLEVATGNINQATRHLQYLATHLLSQGNRELAHAVLVEADHIQQSRQFSQEGEKRIKYGTRALLLPSGSEQIYP
jgi:Ca-activated chloride channel family protein